MRQYSAKTVALAVCGCTALWSIQAAAQNSNNQPTLNQLQQQIQKLQRQVQQLKSQQGQNASSGAKSNQTGGGSQNQHSNQGQNQGQGGQTTQSANSGSSSSPQKKKKGPKKKLSIGGGLAAEYQVRDNSGARNQRDGGNLILDYFSIKASGKNGNLTYGLEERFSTTNFADPQYLHYGWAAYDVNDHSQIKGGYFQVPFGITQGIGYQTFWGNLTYYTGFTDNQAAGVGYKYQNGGWRLDLDAFKNDDLTQNSLYGSNPFDGYQQINGGNGRIGYTFNKGNDNTLDLSLAARGGQLEVGNSNDNGTRWAATAAADASLGPWTVQGQVVGYKYNIPSGRMSGSSIRDDGALATQSITMENYGFGYLMPASGEIYAFNLARTFPVEHLGPINKFQVYNNYAYLHSGEGDYNEFGDRIGDVQFNAVGAEMVAGPVYIWADMLIGKNSAMAFDGGPNGNDNDWHTRFNLTAAFYFDGNLIQ